MNKILKNFNDWFVNISKKKQDNSLDITIVEPPKTANSSVFADVFTPSISARATLWESGELYLQVIEGESGKNIIEEYHTINTSQQLYKLLENFVSRILDI
jgi:hypothetical protein